MPLALGGGPAAAAPVRAPQVVHVGTAIRQDVPSQPGSEPDTVVEPHVAASPVDPRNAVAAAHDGRFPDGGAVGISAAWTRDAGATWQHAPVPGITTATGGPYGRASDPVVAFGPDGTAYLSVLLFNIDNCRTAIAVLRSTDGGQSWEPPSYVHRNPGCNVSDDKNWLVVDSSPASPHYGRLYQFWTSFRFVDNNYLGAPQVVRWSDDRGQTWSDTAFITAIDHGTQNSQPMVLADGTLIDTYYDFGFGMAPDAAPEGVPQRPGRAVSTLAVDATGPIFAARSFDGGQTWQQIGQITNNGAGFAPGVRCCLFAADIDPVTQTMYAAWLGGGPGETDPVLLSSSRDGQVWSSPVAVSVGDVPGVQRVNVDVVARAGKVFVTYGTRTQPGNNGGFVQQQLSTSANAGRTFGEPLSIGPRSILQYAARAGGFFPGDYIGAALSGDRLYLVWARSSLPPERSSSRFHQVILGATVRL